MRQLLNSVKATHLPTFSRVFWSKGCALLLLAVILGFSAGAAQSVRAAAANTPDLPAELRVSKYILVEFYAEWCGICQEMEPYVTTLQTDGCSGFQVVKLDIDKPVNQKYASMYGVDGVPTFILFDKKGKALYRMDQVISPTVLRKKVFAAMGQTAAGSKQVCK